MRPNNQAGPLHIGLVDIKEFGFYLDFKGKAFGGL